MQLAGANHITISPQLLQQLATTSPESWERKSLNVFGNSEPESNLVQEDFKDILYDEGAWRLAFARSGFGTSHGKIIQAINYFVDFQEKLEEIASTYL